MKPRDLTDHPEYVPGRGIEEVARERGLDPNELITLSSNENELGPSPAAVQAIREMAPRAHRYPKAAHTDLTAALGERHDVSTDQIWLANGGDGALDYLSRAMLHPGETVLVPEPGFAYYGMSARFHHGGVRTYSVSRSDDFAMEPDRILDAYDGQRIVYITSPHNPSGATMSLGDVETVAAETGTETLVVVDEAYGDFANQESATALIKRGVNVAVLRSFSKSYGLAGLRLGYVIVPDGLAEAYRRVNTPFAASEIACRAGLAALEDTDHLEKTVTMVQTGREQLHSDLDARTWPSEGNFVLANVGDATVVADALLDRGIIVRDCTSFGLPACIRITVTTSGPLAQAIDACNQVLADTARVTGE